MGQAPAKPELLAPAGSLDVFATAVAAGADAVYVGAPELNARALTRNFSPEELASMIDYGHRSGVKVYLAMNSLMKEEEIPRVIDQLVLLEGLGADALIIQDLGLYFLIRTHFPSFILHASTLMGAHNSLAVRQFADMGFARVVLAREVTLAEAEKIHAQCPVELEVFVHGALCFSYSGLCLFSSYLGGKSSLRGRCVQPCRRKYGWTGPAGAERQGYFFSMNDLEGIELLPRLARAGITSLKIEGRMRSQSYVGAVVRAYRLVIDAGDNLAAVLPEARELLCQAMGRSTTGGYFLSPQPVDAITPYSSGNIGHFLGRIATAGHGRVTLTLEEPLENGDRVRLHHEESGDRDSFTVRELTDTAGGRKERGEKGETVSLLLAGAVAGAGDLLYKVDVRGRRQLEAVREKLAPPNRFRARIAAIRQNGKAARVAKIILEPLPAPQRKGGAGPKRGRARPVPGRRRPELRLWLRGDLRLLSQQLVARPERIIITLDRETAARLQQKKSLRPEEKNMVCALPPIILEDDVPFYRQLVRDLLGRGCRRWMIGHVGQLQLFAGERGRRGPQLAGDYTLNVMNSLALSFLLASGIEAVQLAIETDRDNLRRLCDRKATGSVGLTVFGRPPLFTARLHPDFFRFDKTFVSPRGERFVLRRRWGQTLALAEQPFSLLGQRQELEEAGIDFILVDLTHVSLEKKEIATLRRLLAARGGERARQTFNYFRGLR